MESLFTIVILAGGMATRLRPITNKIPKSMVLIHGEPFISYQLRLLKKRFKKVVLCLGYLGHLIQNYVQNGKQYGLSVTYSYDGKVPLGTAGAIKKALPLLENNFFVIYGDSYLDCNYEMIQQAFTQANKLSLMTIFKNNNQGDKSNIVFKKGEIIEYDKEKNKPTMQYIDYGISVFNRSNFMNIPHNTFYDLSNLYKKLIISKQLAAFQVYKIFYEIGSLAGLVSFENYFKNKALIKETLN